jgi:hypothetical protein
MLLPIKPVVKFFKTSSPIPILYKSWKADIVLTLDPTFSPTYIDFLVKLCFKVPLISKTPVFTRTL